MIGGIVLAAGAGRRFGGGKLVAELDGRPLLEHALEAMLAVPALERVIVVLGSGADEIERSVDLTGTEVVRCDDWSEGMATSLRAGVSTLADAEAVVVTLGDQPFVTAQVIAAIVDQVDAPAPATRAVYDGAPGHPVLIKASLFEAIGRLRGDSGARDLLIEAGAREVECGHLCRADDIDTKEDLEAARDGIGTHPR